MKQTLSFYQLTATKPTTPMAVRVEVYATDNAVLERMATAIRKFVIHDLDAGTWEETSLSEVLQDDGPL